MKILYVGTIREHKIEFNITAYPITLENESEYGTVIGRKWFKKCNLNKSILKYEGVNNNEVYTYFSFDKEKVEDFVNDKKTIYGNKSTKYAEAIKNCEIQYIDYSNLPTIYKGSADEYNAEFFIETYFIIDEDEDYYYSDLHHIDKQIMEQEINAHQYESDYAYFVYYSLDKEKVEEFVKNKRMLYINETKKHLEELENSEITYEGMM